MHNLYAFVTLSATTFLVLHCGVKQRTFGFEKVTNRKFTQLKEPHRLIMRIKEVITN